MVDVSSIAPDAMSKDESIEKEHTWRILGYGNPGTGKTHFGFTMPKPVFCIDTEGKAHSITEKFDGDIYIFEVDNYDEAETALSQALDGLEAYRNEENQIGTLMVDSMSNMWDWAQQKYVELDNPGKSPHEVNFSSALGSGQSDWQIIKRLHNQRFRERMLDTEFNLYWTGTSSEDYGAILEGQDDPPAKPDGEKNNIYKSTEVLHFYEGHEGVPTANLKKNALTKWKFGKLEWPTFDMVDEIIMSIHDAETSDEQITFGELKESFPQEVDLYDGDPDLVYRNADNS